MSALFRRRQIRSTLRHMKRTKSACACSRKPATIPDQCQRELLPLCTPVSVTPLNSPFLRFMTRLAKATGSSRYDFLHTHPAPHRRIEVRRFVSPAARSPERPPCSVSRKCCLRLLLCRLLVRHARLCRNNMMRLKVFLVRGRVISFVQHRNSFPT